MTSTLLLRARPVSRRYNDHMHAAYDIYEGDMQVPRLSVIFAAGGWDVVALETRYGIMPCDIQMAHDIKEHILSSMQLREVLAVIRALIEYEHEQLRQEAMYELETERRAEAFWENRMSDEDKAREDWEYSMYGA